VLTPNNDITAYLPTNIMSITDGQWIMDLQVFLSGNRPALSTGLSVTRVGGVGQNKRQKGHTAAAMKALATYRQAEEYAHFGSELALSAHKDLARGKSILELFNQPPTVTYSFIEQQLMLDIVLKLDDTAQLDVKKLKEKVRDIATTIKDDSQFDGARDQLQAASMLEKMAPVASAPAPTELSSEGEAKEASDEEKASKELKDAKDKPKDDNKSVDEAVAKPIDVDKDGKVTEIKDEATK
jgi:F-type H+-transporting ATPase subunit alpha